MFSSTADVGNQKLKETCFKNRRLFTEERDAKRKLLGLVARHPVDGTTAR